MNLDNDEAGRRATESFCHDILLPAEADAEPLVRDVRIAMLPPGFKDTSDYFEVRCGVELGCIHSFGLFYDIF